MRRHIKYTGVGGLLCLLAGGLPSFAKADNYVLLIGVGKYENGITSLPYDVNDVRGLEKAFLKNARYRPDHVAVMTTEAKETDPSYPKLTNVYSTLKTILGKMKEDDTLILYFSGHGMTSGGDQYLLFADTILELPQKTAMSLKDLNDEFKRFKSVRHKIVILDACRNDPTPPGEAATSKDIAPEAVKGLHLEASRIATQEGAANTTYEFIFACQPGQKAQVLQDGRHNSVYSHFLIQGLRGQALRKGRQLTLDDLTQYAREHVETWAKTDSWAKTHNVEQQPYEIGRKGKTIILAENLSAVLPVKLELKGLDDDVRVEVTPQKYNKALGEVELDSETESGTLTLRRPGYKPQTREMTFKSDTPQSVSADAWTIDASSRIRFVFPKTPSGVKWGKMGFDTQAVSLEKDDAKKPLPDTRDVRSQVMDFLLDKDAVKFSVSLTNKNAPISFGPALLKGGQSYEVNFTGNRLTVEPELSVYLVVPSDPALKVYVVPEGTDYQVRRTGRDAQVLVNGIAQPEHTADQRVMLDMGLEEEKQFWALCCANGKVQRKTIRVTKQDAAVKRTTGTAARLQLPPGEGDNTEATLDLAALPPGVSATVTVKGTTYLDASTLPHGVSATVTAEGTKYSVDGSARSPLTFPIESNSVVAMVVIDKDPQFDPKGFPVTLTVGKTATLKRELEDARLSEETVEIVNNAQKPVEIVAVDGKLAQGLPALNKINAKPGSDLRLTLHSAGYYLKEETIPVAAGKKQYQVQFEPLEPHLIAPPAAWVKKNAKGGADMIYIPAGNYSIGAAKPDKPHENGQTTASGGFWVYAYPVTVGQYLAYCASAGHNRPDMPSLRKKSPALPMTEISVEDARAYAEWAGGALPTEEQWEIAARGRNGGMYPWGDDWKMAQDWRYGKDTAVGSKPLNHSSFGVGDIWGHVREWTTSGADNIVVRGSSFAKMDKKVTRLTWRSVEDNSGKAYEDIGFRVVEKSSVQK